MQTYTTTAADRPVATDETDRLISSDKVVGTTVYNLQDEHLGSVYNLMVDKISGQVAYAVMSFGGFLGMGESYHPLPWRVLKYGVRQGGYVVDLDRRRLEGAPSYTASSLPNWSDRDYGRRVDEYYGVPPYGFEARPVFHQTRTATIVWAGYPRLRLAGVSTFYRQERTHHEKDYPNHRICHR